MESIIKAEICNALPLACFTKAVASPVLTGLVDQAL